MLKPLCLIKPPTFNYKSAASRALDVSNKTINKEIKEQKAFRGMIFSSLPLTIQQLRTMNSKGSQ